MELVIWKYFQVVMMVYIDKFYFFQKFNAKESPSHFSTILLNLSLSNLSRADSSAVNCLGIRHCVSPGLFPVTPVQLWQPAASTVYLHLYFLTCTCNNSIAAYKRYLHLTFTPTSSLLCLISFFNGMRCLICKTHLSSWYPSSLLSH